MFNKKRCLSILLTTYNYFLILIETIVIKKILIKKISIKETRCRILEYHAGFKRFMKYSHNLRNSYNEVNF